jgi:hypothetical protein
MIRPLFIISLLSCSFNPEAKQEGNITKINRIEEISLPNSFSRIKGKDSLFTKYLLALEFKKENTVLLFDGSPKANQSVHYKVLNLGVGKNDLQQCADAVIRLRAEYLFKQKRFHEIQFHFTSGHLCKWLDYSEGYRPKISGSQVKFIKTEWPDPSLKNFNRYLDLIYTYCGTASLYKELKSKSIELIEPGDVFIQTGNPFGHAVMVMDVAKNKDGKLIFTLAQSYMPAQEIHILKNENSDDLNPWYEAKRGPIETPEWTFNSDDLKHW